MRQGLKRGFSQSSFEAAERARLAEVNKRGEREAQTKAEGSKLAAERNETLKQFELRDMVTDGTVVGRIVELDPKRGEVVVRLRTGRDRRFSPEYLRKI